jgi:hypothetical protein
MKFKNAQIHQIYHLQVFFKPFQQFNGSEALVYIWDNTLVLSYEFLATTADIKIPSTRKSSPLHSLSP